MLEFKTLFNRFSLHQLFFFFKTKRPFLIIFLVSLGEGQLHKYTETDHVT